MSILKRWLGKTLPLVFDRENVMEEMEIPIFPLKTVLFPGGVLPIRVFETRYMDMTKACMKSETPFAVCLIKEGEEAGSPAIPEEVGTLAQIVDWDMQEQGILNIRTQGGRRIAIQSTRVEDSGLVMANVTTVTDEAPQPVPEALDHCSALLRKIVAQVGEDKFSPPLDFDDAVWVSYRLAETLPLKLSAKQNMLEMNDPIMRLRILHQFLAQQGLST